jgi:Sec7-like guanine-nucleotide exchange factor
MSGNGSDLFAGLSLAPSSSPGSKDSSPSMKVSTTSPSIPSAVPSSTSSASTVTTVGARQYAGSSPPPPPVPAPTTASPRTTERVQSAPVTDKLLGLLGDSSGPSSPSPRPPAPPSASPPTRASSAPMQPSLSTTTRTGSPSFSPARKAFGSGSSPVSSGSNGTRKLRASKAPAIGVGKGNTRAEVLSSDAEQLKMDEDIRDIQAAFCLDDNYDSTPKKDQTSSKKTSKTTTPKVSVEKSQSSSIGEQRFSERPPQLNNTSDHDGSTSSNIKRHSLRGVGVVQNETPIPNCDVALRLFRKFVSKTQVHVPESHGGTQKLSLWTRYVSGTPAEYDTRFDAYKQLVEVLAVGTATTKTENDTDDSTDHDQEGSSSSDAIVDAVLGESGDTMAKARRAMATFVHLMSVWSHVSANMAESEKSGADHHIFCGMVATGYDTATALATYGCLDGIMVGIGPDGTEYHKVVEVLAESVFSGDLSQPVNELAAMKFLLSTGCRATTTDGQSMLRGSHLLQTIRVLYHVYLTTTTEANKTTARASLQQLVTSVFIRMIASPSSADETDFEKYDNPGSPSKPMASSDLEPNFPTENHRDAFLVLRSLCKLSMRAPPAGERHSHVGLQTSGSNAAWDASKDSSSKMNGSSGAITDNAGSDHPRDNLHHLQTHAIHPALESKILALDLLLYVLTRTEMGESFLQQCGAQFHYAIRNYLCVSLLKNCTSDDTRVVNLSLRVFVPIFRNFRSILKTEIEAFVTNVFFVILDSKNSPIEHKSLVVTLFDEICSDPTTLAEIFLNYDCDMSAVDLFHRIVNTLSKVARTTEVEDPNAGSTLSLVVGSDAARMEKMRSENRELRLGAMRALRQVLASLHASIVEPMKVEDEDDEENNDEKKHKESRKSSAVSTSENGEEKQSLVEIYDSKKRRRQEESEVILRFNQKPKAGIAYASKCGHVDGSDPADVARFLLKNKDNFEKTQIGEFLGREPEYEQGFSLKVLHEYGLCMDFEGLTFDDAIRYYLSGFRLPGEAQKIDRIMEKFAERYTAQNPDAFATADVAFILSFSIIMLNTDLHNPAIKEERRMTKEGFIRNNRGISDGQDLPEEMLTSIFDRIKENPISLKEDDEARERAGEATTNAATNALSPAVFFTSHYDEMEKTKESNFNKERDQIVRTTESLLKRRRHSTAVDSPGRQSHRKSRASGASKSHHVRYVRTKDSGMRDEYVAPMFEVTWGPALAAFSTAMESANGTVGALLSIATDDELEAAAANAAETIEVCLTGFRFAICTAGLVGNVTARDAYMLALSRFSQLGTGILLEPRHVRCVQTMLALARSDSELLGSSWEHVFRGLSEIARFHQIFHLMARNDRVVAAAAERRKSRIAEREKRHEERERRRVARETSDSIDEGSVISTDSESDVSYADSSLFDESDAFSFDDEMDTKEIDEANARTMYEAVSEELIEAIYERSSSMSTAAVKEFILQLCRVSRMEISHYGGQVGSDSNQVDLTKVQYRKQHELLAQAPSKDKEGFHHQQTNIYNLQKLVEVTHYNMDSRPRLVFEDLWITISAHLTSTALHSNPAVAMYAVDSFRQLSIQYLQREELGVFEFQRKFLKPLEFVMARSEVSTTKELLLKCVERIILMFGSSKDNGKGGFLRSGWRPVLTVLGLAGRDPDKEIANMGFEMLSTQIRGCLDECSKGNSENRQGVLLVERFVDLVDALMIYVEGPHEQMSLQCIEDILKLCDFLADDSTASPLVKRRRTTSFDGEQALAGDSDKTSNQELELWWPILLGLSRSVGDPRKKIRWKALESLMKVISAHFFPTIEKSKTPAASTGLKSIQTLQLIYRGILSPVLEFGDVEAQDAKTPELPSDFDRFLTSSKPGEANNIKETRSWLDTTYDPFMDGCIQICLRSIDAFEDDTLVEEIFAMINNCLGSDSGALAVKGLRRMEQFVSSDLRLSSITDDTWATVSHMLRRCLSVRGMPRRSSSVCLNDSDRSATTASAASADEASASSATAEQQEAVREFIVEDEMFFDRRYIGSNTIAVIGKFLEGERFVKTLGLRWRLFLVTGVGTGIREWESAAAVLAKNGVKSGISPSQTPPNYLETAYYARKWMNRFLLQIATLNEIEGTAAEGSRQAAAQALVKEQTQALVSAFLAKEAVVAAEGKKTALDLKLFERLMSLVQDMLAGYTKLPDEHLSGMSWLNPVLSSCIHTGNEDIRLSIQKLVLKVTPPA